MLNNHSDNSNNNEKRTDISTNITPSETKPAAETAAKSWKKPFFTLAIGQTVSLVGSSAVQFALIWWLASETGSALMLSLAGLIAFLPQLLLGPFAGVWVDRLKRRNVIIIADLFIGLCAGVFALLFLFMDVPYWVACVVIGLRSLGNVFHSPAITAALPMIVPAEQIVRANGWSQFMQSGAFMLGPVLGAALYAALPLPVIMLADVVGAVFASICTGLISIPDPPREQVEKTNFLAELKDGAKAVLADKRLTVALLTSTASMIFYLPLSTLFPLMTSNYFAATPWHASAVELIYAAGMMLAAMMISARGKLKNHFRTIHLAMIALGLVSLLSGILPNTMPWFWVFTALCAVMGGAGNYFNVGATSYIQLTIEPEKQGRAFSLMTSLMSLAMPLGLVMAGPYSENNGVESWFFITGIAVVCITLVSMLIVGRIKQPERQGAARVTEVG